MLRLKAQTSLFPCIGLGNCFWFKNLNFNSFFFFFFFFFGGGGGGFRNLNILGDMTILWIFLEGRSSQNLAIFRGHFVRSRYRMRDIFLSC